MKANNVINRVKKIGVKRKKIKEYKEYLFKKMFPLLEFCKIIERDLEAKKIMIAKQKEDTKKILEMIKSQTIIYQNKND